MTVQTVLFVVLCCFPFIRLVWVTGCYTLYLLFKLFSLYQQEDPATTGCFSWKSCRKSCSLLFPFQQACLSRLLYVVLVVLVVFPISARRLSNDGLLFLKKLPQKLFFVVSLSSGLSESQVVICCTCCSSCFPYISKKTQQEAAA